jgi:hypothetical protein
MEISGSNTQLRNNGLKFNYIYGMRLESLKIMIVWQMVVFYLGANEALGSGFTWSKLSQGKFARLQINFHRDN